jgi:hypothetical protein
LLVVLTVVLLLLTKVLKLGLTVMLALFNLLPALRGRGKLRLSIGELILENLFGGEVSRRKKGGRVKRRRISPRGRQEQWKNRQTWRPRRSDEVDTRREREEDRKRRRESSPCAEETEKWKNSEVQRGRKKDEEGWGKEGKEEGGRCERAKGEKQGTNAKYGRERWGGKEAWNWKEAANSWRPKERVSDWKPEAVDRERRDESEYKKDQNGRRDYKRQRQETGTITTKRRRGTRENKDEEREGEEDIATTDIKGREGKTSRKERSEKRTSRRVTVGKDGRMGKLQVGKQREGSRRSASNVGGEGNSNAFGEVIGPEDLDRAVAVEHIRAVSSSVLSPLLVEVPRESCEDRLEVWWLAREEVGLAKVFVLRQSTELAPKLGGVVGGQPSNEVFFLRAQFEGTIEEGERSWVDDEREEIETRDDDVDFGGLSMSLHCRKELRHVLSAVLVLFEDFGQTEPHLASVLSSSFGGGDVRVDPPIGQIPSDGNGGDVDGRTNVHVRQANAIAAAQEARRPTSGGTKVGRPEREAKYRWWW